MDRAEYILIFPFKLASTNGKDKMISFFIYLFKHIVSKTVGKLMHGFSRLFISVASLILKTILKYIIEIKDRKQKNYKINL